MVVEINAFSIRILDKDFNEIVGWVIDEWKEDENIVISIVNAIKVYYVNGEDRLKEILKTGG